MRTTLAAAALLLAALPAKADGLIASITSCRELASGPLPMSCGYTVADDLPTFVFAFTAESGMSVEEMASIVVEIIEPACAKRPVAIVYATILEGVRVMKIGACKAGETHFQEGWRPMEDAQ